MNPKKLRRAIRLVVFATVAGIAATYWNTRPEKFPIGVHRISLYPYFQEEDHLLIRVIEPDDELHRDEWVLFAIDKIAYFGVARGMPGDKITAPEGYLAVNGQPVVVHGRRFPGRPAGEVPANKLYVLCMNPGVRNDSRTFGFIGREQVKGIILHEK